MDLQGSPEELKSRYIEVCLRIEKMEAEAARVRQEWRRHINTARELRRRLLGRIRTADGRPYTPALPFDGEGEAKC